MKKQLSLAIALAVGSVGIVTSSHAATVVVDDAVFGVGTVLRDTTNNLEFLRLDLTMGYGYNGVVAEMGAGGTFDGWQVASAADMFALGASEGIIHGSSDPTQVAMAEDLRDWFCPTGTCVNLSSTHEYARGLVSDAGPNYQSGAPSLQAFSIGRRFNVSPEEVDFRLSGYGSYTDTSEEIWMVRSSVVPVPAAVWLFGSGLIGLAGVARRKRQA